jgi:hypothetical protein
MLMKKCPYCAEEIQDGAVKYKHCCKTLPAGKKSETKAALETVVWLLLGTGLLLAMWLVLHGFRHQHYIFR